MSAIGIDVRVRRPLMSTLKERLMARSKWEKKSVMKKLIYLVTIPAQLAFGILMCSFRVTNPNCSYLNTNSTYKALEQGVGLTMAAMHSFIVFLSV